MSVEMPYSILREYHIVAVVGSRTYNSPEVFKRVLDKRQELWPEKVAFISGGAKGVDTDFRRWCRLFGPSQSFFIEVTAIRPGDTDNYFLRNAVIASLADEVIGFVQRDKYRSGTWNTIKHFRDKQNLDILKFSYTVYDEKGEVWDRKWKKK
jgi:predicted Rossmann fold nucleotide-binding protein DprA/Smf involved in DNA uptake